MLCWLTLTVTLREVVVVVAETAHATGIGRISIGRLLVGTHGHRRPQVRGDCLDAELAVVDLILQVAQLPRNAGSAGGVRRRAVLVGGWRAAERWRSLVRVIGGLGGA